MDEFELLKQIFRNVLHYNYVEKKRVQTNFKNYDEFVMKGNELSRVIVINAKNSNMSSIKKDKDYLNEIYINMYTEYGIDIKNVSVYFIWDRDNKSNPKYVVKSFINKLGNAMENKNGDMNGLLLLSYPSLEAYIINNFDNKTIFLNDNNLKRYVKEKDYKITQINKHTLLRAAVMMNKTFLKMGIFDYELSDFSSTSLEIFEKQEMMLKTRNYYYLLSFVSLKLIDLNIITIR